MSGKESEFNFAPQTVKKAPLVEAGEVLVADVTKAYERYAKTCKRINGGGPKKKQARDTKGMGAHCVGVSSPVWWPPTTLQELCDAEHPKGKTWWQWWRGEFDAYDGIDGRPTLKERLESAWDFWFADRRKGRWKTPAGFTESLRGAPPGGMNYVRCRNDRERMMRFATGGDVNEAPGADRRPFEAHGRNPGDIGVAGRSKAVRLGDEVKERLASFDTTTQDPDEVAEGLALLRGGK